MQQRPSVKEIIKKLNDAQNALNNQKLLFANPVKAVGELNQLDIVDTNELMELLVAFLDEILHTDYAGTKPPMRSYEALIADCELWAFSWPSAVLEKNMYLKFALKEEYFYLVSLHVCRVNSAE